MPFIKVYVHFVWAAKNKIPFLAIKEVRKTIWNHVRANANKNGIRLDFINGYFDHYHCLMQLEAGQTIEKVIKILNGEKTFWINKKGISTESFTAELPPILDAEIDNKLDWKEDYFLISVSESVLERVSNYTRNQLDDNREKLFDKKYREYIIQYGFQKTVDK